nr:delta-like protein 4 isoform X1 [Paramormyrops kingsleyae]
MSAWLTFAVAFNPIVLAQVFESGVFELNLLEFKNNMGLLANGNTCKPDCRTFFRVCLKNYQTVVSPGNCIFGSVVTPVLGTNSFSATEGGSVNRLIRLPFTFGWPGSFSLIIEAWHSLLTDVPTGPNDPELLISLFAIQRKLDVGDGWREEMQIGRQTQLRYSYRFVCSEHYYGDSCSRKCSPRDDRFGHYTCTADGYISCLPGWKGEYCVEPICLEGCSKQNGNCSRPGECLCRDGWQGALCDQCRKYPTCKHGTCQQPWQCNCEEGWGGLLCDQDLNYCTHHKPCRNGATCMNTGQGSYTCTCPPGFTGADCQLGAPECSSSPCQNGGECVDLEDGYRCICPRGTDGAHCQHRLLTCADVPCFHSGRCRDKQGGQGYVCECPWGFTGLNCERRLDRCSLLPCANGGWCVLQSGRPVCSCPAGFTGPRCEINTNWCNGSPCANGGTCVPQAKDYSCACPPGHTGRRCDTPTEPCVAQPCLHGGTCLGNSTGQSPSCVCPTHYTGPNCQYHVMTLPLAPSQEEPRSALQWAAMSMGVGLVILLLLLSMVAVALNKIHRQRNGERRDGDAVNNMPHVDKDNLIPTLQLKKTNEKVAVEDGCTQGKSNQRHSSYHLDYNSAKDFKDDWAAGEKRQSNERRIGGKIPLSRMYSDVICDCSETPKCKISTICSPGESTYQALFLIADRSNRCFTVTEV